MSFISCSTYSIVAPAFCGHRPNLILSFFGVSVMANNDLSFLFAVTKSVLCLIPR